MYVNKFEKWGQNGVKAFSKARKPREIKWYRELTKGSIPLRSICGKCLKTLDFGHFPYFILVNFMLFGSFQDVSV